ncbi:UNVERIFIED_CONTAM: hypothetical protein Slati_4455600 [Sesamum latifolium]|uniref:Reverse transcriptase domain-containing protein n=1 Tax=Sesamum latifolium TaxID=2727402 RepID=A0AAW2SS64_9LAMI
MVQQYTRKWISPRYTINVDLRKAFDSISWTFLSGVLHGGFERLHPRVFSSKKGLRQGDQCPCPLPSLDLSRLIKRKTSNSSQLPPEV